MIHSLVGPIPHHLYVFVDTTFTHQNVVKPRWQPAVWFGLVSIPSRMWGCTVMLESGAVYRGLPPHALAFTAHPYILEPEEAQTWDCYSTDFSTTIYPYMTGLRASIKTRHTLRKGHYLFSAAPVGDGFSLEPAQNKEFHFLALDAGGLTIQPTNRVVYEERSFTTESTDDGTPMSIPRLKTQTEVYSCE